MNCKQGDLAIIVGCVNVPVANGRIVRCVAFVPDYNIPAWDIDPPVVAPDGVYPSIHDSLLRPINNPGEDAVDEIVRLVGSPSGVTA